MSCHQVVPATEMLPWVHQLNISENTSLQQLESYLLWLIPYLCVHKFIIIANYNIKLTNKYTEDLINASGIMQAPHNRIVQLESQQ